MRERACEAERCLIVVSDVLHPLTSPDDAFLSESSFWKEKNQPEAMSSGFIKGTVVRLCWTSLWLRW